MIGLDTGFFVALLRDEPVPRKIWKQVIEGDLDASCSCLTFFELERLGLRGAVDKKATTLLLRAIPALCKVIWLDVPEPLVESARLSHTHGIPSLDALILGGLLHVGAKKVYTTDSDLGKLKRRGVKVINLRSATR